MICSWREPWCQHRQACLPGASACCRHCNIDTTCRCVLLLSQALVPTSPTLLAPLLRLASQRICFVVCLALPSACAAVHCHLRRYAQQARCCVLRVRVSKVVMTMSDCMLAGCHASSDRAVSRQKIPSYVLNMLMVPNLPRHGTR